MAISEEEVDEAIPYLKATEPSHQGDGALQVNEANSPVLTDFIPSIKVAYLVDKGTSFEYLQYRHLGNRTEAELHQRSLRNLTAKVNFDIRPYKTIKAVIAGGNFEASLVLIHQHWRREAMVYGPLACAIAARDVLAYCPQSDLDGITELRSVIERIWPNGDHLITKRLLAFDENGWRYLDA